MVVAMQLLGYLLAVSCLALVAIERANRSSHPLRGEMLVGFGSAGLIATLVASAENVLSPMLIVTFACVAVCAATDLSSGLIYNSVVASAACCAVANALIGDTVGSFGGAGLGFGLGMTLRIVTGGRGLGLGDVKLFALVGSGVGIFAIAFCFGGAFVIGAIVSLALIAAARMKRSTSVRFAPYIAVAAMTMPCVHVGVL